MAERLAVAGLRSRLGDGAQAFRVSSAGTYAHAGAAMEPFAQQLVTELGGDPAGFVARDLLAELVAEADLVLGAGREHRAAAVTALPSASPRVFTVLEFARLCDRVDVDTRPADPVARARAAVPAAAGKRGLARPAQPGDDDIPDPYQRSLADFRVAAESIRGAIERILPVLVG